MELNRNQVEQWRRLAAVYDPLAAGRSLDDTREILSPPKAAMPSKLGKTLNNDIDKALEISCPRACGLLFSSPCVPQILRELTAQQDLFPDHAQMGSHIVTVIKSRISGSAPMMMGNLNDEASHCDVSSDEFVESED